MKESINSYMNLLKCLRTFNAIFSCGMNSQYFVLLHVPDVSSNVCLKSPYIGPHLSLHLELFLVNGKCWLVFTMFTNFLHLLVDILK
jgi:hypothetical protein